ncbi:CoA-ligase [Musa troglodytarum]|uniref:CoA-ligase n=1 Tax=Musa troglodytarum TaxID=320322 RepID=A0A9E7EUP6_9LILI|nr:CoA-ligase [Musa troglodytarum]
MKKDFSLFHFTRTRSLFSTGMSENLLMNGNLHDRLRDPQRASVPSLVASTHRTSLTRATASFWPLLTMSSATCSKTVNGVNECSETQLQTQTMTSTKYFCVNTDQPHLCKRERERERERLKDQHWMERLELNHWSLVFFVRGFHLSLGIKTVVQPAHTTNKSHGGCCHS